MTVKLKRHFQRAAWSFCNTAKPASSTATGLPLQQNWQYLGQWIQDGNLLMYSGPPDKTYNGNETCYFYVIDHLPPRANAGTRHLAGALKCWLHNAEGNSRTITWRPVYDSGATEVVLYDEVPTNGTTSDTYENEAHGPLIQLGGYDDFYLTPDATEDKFVCGRLECTETVPAALSIWHAPTSLNNLNAAASLGLGGGSDLLSVLPDDVSLNRIISGYDPDDADCDEYRSLGALQHLIAEPRSATWSENMENITRRTLFQWAHPAGLWIESTCINAFNESLFRVKCRDFSASTYHQPCYPGLVVSGGTEGDLIYFYSSNAADAWYIELGSNAPFATPQLLQWNENSNNGAASGVEFDYSLAVHAGNGATDDIKIYVDKEVGDDLVIHTVALFEGPSTPLIAG